MPHPSQPLPTIDARVARRLPVCAGFEYPPGGDAPVKILLSDPAGLAALTRRVPVAESAPELPFHRLQIVLASARAGSPEWAVVEHEMPSPAEDDRRTAGAQTGTDLRRIEMAPPASTMKQASDPVIVSLSDALAAAERACDQHSRIYADAVRLAIAIRLLGQERQCALRNSELIEQGSATRPVRALQKWRLKRVLEYIDDRLSNKITLGDLAAVAGLSRMHFASQFRAATGHRPHEYLLRQRIQRAEQLLLGSAMSIVEIALAVGFQTQAHFTTVFKRFMGDTPCQWRNAHADDPASPWCR